MWSIFCSCLRSMDSKRTRSRSIKKIRENIRTESVGDYTTLHLFEIVSDIERVSDLWIRKPTSIASQCSECSYVWECTHTPHISYIRKHVSLKNSGGSKYSAKVITGKFNIRSASDGIKIHDSEEKLSMTS